MQLKTDGLTDLAMDFQTMANLPDSVIDNMLEAEAEVIADAQKTKARAMGVYDTGAMVNAIEPGKPSRNKSGAFITVAPKGTVRRHGTTYSLSERAFLNEFGKKGQPARPFMRTANEEAADRAVDAAMKVYDKFLDNL